MIAGLKSESTCLNALQGIADNPTLHICSTPSFLERHAVCATLPIITEKSALSSAARSRGTISNENKSEATSFFMQKL